MNDLRVLDWLDSPEGEEWLNGYHAPLRSGCLMAVKGDNGYPFSFPVFLWHI